MTTNDDLKAINRRRVADFISHDLQQYVGKFNTGSVRESITRTLESFKDRGLITDSPKSRVGKIGQLWKIWTIKQKAKWVLCNNVFPWIANDIREKVDKHNSFVSEFNYKFAGKAYAVITEVGLVELEEIKLPEDNIIEEYEAIDYPQWAITSPKSIVVTDIYVQLTHPVEFINFNITLGKDK